MTDPVKPLPDFGPRRSRSPEFLHSAARWALAAFMAVTAIGGGFFYLKLVEITDNQAAAKARGLAILEDGDRTEQLLLNATAVACRLLLDDPAVADICADPDISELLAGS